MNVENLFPQEVLDAPLELKFWAAKPHVQELKRKAFEEEYSMYTKAAYVSEGGKK